MQPAAALIQAYLATRYLVVAPGDRTAILAEARVGSRSRELDQLLDNHGARSGVFITAWNPRSHPVERARNEAAHGLLEQELRRRDVRFLPHLGAGPDPAWEPEHGMFALDLPLAEALELAVAFDQNAIVVVEQGQTAELVTTALMPAA
jgi:hypothetical protein